MAFVVSRLRTMLGEIHEIYEFIHRLNKNSDVLCEDD